MTGEHPEFCVPIALLGSCQLGDPGTIENEPNADDEYQSEHGGSATAG